MNHTEQRKANQKSWLARLIIFIYYINSWVWKLKNQTFQSELCVVYFRIFNTIIKPKLDWKYHLIILIGNMMLLVF